MPPGGLGSLMNFQTGLRTGDRCVPRLRSSVWFVYLKVNNVHHIHMSCFVANEVNKMELKYMYVAEWFKVNKQIGPNSVKKCPCCIYVSTQGTLFSKTIATRFFTRNFCFLPKMNVS
jgi:hypothetical protein